MTIIKIDSRVCDKIEDDVFITNYLKEIINQQLGEFKVDVTGQSDFIKTKLSNIVNKLMFFYTQRNIDVKIGFYEKVTPKQETVIEVEIMPAVVAEETSMEEITVVEEVATPKKRK
jgi:hypothetical protein